jgi:hypothetical protein
MGIGVWNLPFLALVPFHNLMVKLINQAGQKNVIHSENGALSSLPRLILQLYPASLFLFFSLVKNPFAMNENRWI